MILPLPPEAARTQRRSGTAAERHSSRAAQAAERRNSAGAHSRRTRVYILTVGSGAFPTDSDQPGPAAGADEYDQDGSNPDESNADESDADESDAGETRTSPATSAANEPAPGLPPADERRQITVLFTDLVGSTELASVLDPEDWHSVLASYQDRVAEVVAAHGGTVIQFQGDGVLACFGYPRAVETAARDAVATGMAVVDAVNSLNEQIPKGVGRLQARAGVHTGLVVVTAARTGGTARPADIFGEVPNLAARLQGAATAGQVIVSDTTASAIAGYFELAALPPLLLRGIERHIQAHQVLRSGPARNRLEASKLVSFVSRQAEWAWLQQQWEVARQGPARALLIAGEPGIGKSRLAMEFGGSLSAAGTIVHTAHCTRASKLSPLQPFGSVLGRVPAEPAEVVDHLCSEAGRGPVLLIVDDAHWADPSSIEVVQRLLRLDLPLLVLLTARPESMERPQAPYPTSSRLTLDRLSDEDARDLLAHVPGGVQLDQGLVSDLVRRADGVPLYLEEMARAVISRAGDSAGAMPVSVTLTDIIASRLDGLGPSRWVAQSASVIGREFDATVLASAADLPAGEVHERLDDLVEQAIVRPDPSRPGVFLFRHALIHEAAYSSLMRPDRRAVHDRIAHTLQAAGYHDLAPQILAYHLGNAGRAEEAARMWRVAARRARRHSRFREAAGHERQILRLLPQLPAESRDATELGARGRLALCLEAVDQEAPEVMTEAARAQALARSLGDHRSLLKIFLLLMPWWQARTDYQAIDDALPEALELARLTDDPFSTASVRLLAGTMRVWQGRLEEATYTLSEAFVLSGMPLEHSLTTQPPMSPPAVISRSSTRVAAALGWWLSGDASTAWRLTADTLKFTAERKIAPAEAVTAATAAMIAQLEGDRENASRYAAASLMARASDERPDDGASSRWQQWAAALAYWAENGQPRDEEPAVPGPLLRPYFLTLRADDGRLAADDALRLVEEALRTVRQTGEYFCEAEILRVRGRLLAESGQPDRAAMELASAVATARFQQARSLELKALTELLRLTSDSSLRPRLADLIDQLGDNGPALIMEKGRRALADSST